MVISWVYEVLYVVRFDWEYIYIIFYTGRRRSKRRSIHNAMYKVPCHYVPSMYLSCEREKKVMIVTNHVHTLPIFLHIHA